MAVLVLIDIQKEYTTPGRAFSLKGIEQSLSNAKRILDFARKQHMDGVFAKVINTATVLQLQNQS